MAVCIYCSMLRRLSGKRCKELVTRITSLRSCIGRCVWHPRVSWRSLSKTCEALSTSDVYCS